MRMIKKKPFDRKAKILLAAIIGAIFIIPFFPLATKKAWVYTNKPGFCISCHTMEKSTETGPTRLIETGRAVVTAMCRTMG